MCPEVLPAGLGEKQPLRGRAQLGLTQLRQWRNNCAPVGLYAALATLVDRR